MKRSVLVLAQVLLGLVSSAGLDARAATSAVQVDTLGQTFETAGQYTLGFQFMVTEEVRLVTLGVFDGGAPGLDSDAQVSLWLDDLAGTLLASATVQQGTGALLDGHFRHVAIGPVSLSPGILYVVGAYLAAGEATAFNMGAGSSSGHFDARLSNVFDRNWDDGHDFPLGSDGVANAAWLGANFQLAPVPEPASAGLLLAGLLGGGLWRRRSRAADLRTQPD